MQSAALKYLDLPTSVGALVDMCLWLRWALFSRIKSLSRNTRISGSFCFFDFFIWQFCIRCLIRLKIDWIENKPLTFVKSDQLVGVLSIVLESPPASGSGKSTLLNGLIGKAEARFKGQLPTYVMHRSPPETTHQKEVLHKSAHRAAKGIKKGPSILNVLSLETGFSPSSYGVQFECENIFINEDHPNIYASLQPTQNIPKLKWPIPTLSLSPCNAVVLDVRDCWRKR